MENRVKKSSLNAKEFYDYERLVHKTEGFIPARYEEELEELIFHYEMEGLKPITEIKGESRENQYRLLINMVKLASLTKIYEISFTPGNLFYDENFLVLIQQRDLYSKGVEGNEEAFMEVYRAYVGGVLGKKYTTTMLLQSGSNLLKKEQDFIPYLNAQTPEEMAGLLREKRDALQKEMKEKKVVITKSSNRIKTTVSILSTVLLIGCLVGMGYLSLKILPKQRQLIQANESFIARDFVGCIDQMKETEVEEMDASTKYILATSYARSESLKKEEIESIVAKLSTSSNEKELEYWIYLGRLQSDKAQDMAQALSDDQLLMYAYMKELSLLETNTKIAGEEKSQRIQTLEDNINKLGKKYEENVENNEEK
ncbi:type VII secretion protein EssB [Aequitasia blattaphilus]|uniref:Type VII secretion protein EssB n=1 Tax=Aequitasia blattaphilus TaxID=2949332 RepID=A0ABT1EB65_9FIRM|nr:type VII secretion protein EssB/YukC [Aequitasia blattaphilus]MCP1103079.1 hypothetical protein [Aequitasia blattaphilus]MCR8615719.1 hypothetical protein [Aequitasia blattaphilus]